MRGVIMGDIMPAHGLQGGGRFREVPFRQSGPVTAGDQHQILRGDPAPYLCCPDPAPPFQTKGGTADYNINCSLYHWADCRSLFESTVST